MPAREVDVRARRANGVRDSRQRRASVDEGLDAAARARLERRIAGPATGGRVDRLPAAVPPQPQHVAGADRALDRLADEVVQPVQRVMGHGALVPTTTGLTTR